MDGGVIACGRCSATDGFRHGFCVGFAGVDVVFKVGFSRECVFKEPFEKGEVKTGASKDILRSVDVGVDKPRDQVLI
jgi:hypothetical protein